MSTTPAGWYDDGQGALRWWDGAQWTGHTHPLPTPAPDATAATTPDAAAAPFTPDAVVPAPAAPDAGAPEATVTEPALPEPAAPEAAAPEATLPEPVAFEAVAPDAAAPDSAAPAAEAPPVPQTPAADAAHAAGVDPGSPAGAHPGSVPAQPAAYPGVPSADAPVPSYAPAGLPVPPAAPKSRAWVLPVAIGGGLLVLLIVLGVILVPIILGLVSNIGSVAGGGGGSGSGGGSSEPEVSGSEAEAVDVVERYDQAWDDADCDEFLAVTTEDFRTVQQIVDCDAFVGAADSFDTTTDDYEIEVTSVDTESETRIVVRTVESYTSYIDDAGEDAPEGLPVSDVYTYTLVSQDGTWVIDDATIE